MIRTSAHRLKDAGKIGLLISIVTGLAGGQSVSTDAKTINDPRPLAKAAEALMVRYGVPINYEDVSAYVFEGDLVDPNALRATHPNAKVRLPRNSILTINFTEPQGLADPQNPNSPRPADPGGVAKLLQGVINQHASNGNPGRFKLLETVIGTTIVPTATRNNFGDLVPDHSLLDLRISFPEMEGDATQALTLFCEALSAASGKNVSLTEGYQATVRIGARDEVARDVLAKLISGMRRNGGLFTGGLLTSDFKPAPMTKLVWRLITEPGIDPPYTASYSLSLGEVVMERSAGRTTTRTPVWRESDSPTK